MIEELVSDDFLSEKPIVFSTQYNRYLAVISGWKADSEGCALLLPGSGLVDIDGRVGPNRFLLQLATGLADCGIPTVRFSKRPLSSLEPSADNYEKEYLEPVSALFKTLSSRGFLNIPVVIIGHSLGGHVAPYIARHITHVKGIIVINANFDNLSSIVAWQINHLDPVLVTEYESLKEPFRQSKNAKHLSELKDSLARYFYNSTKYNLKAELSELKTPFLCIGCENDGQVPVEQMDKWINALRSVNLPVEYCRLEHLNHLCMSADSKSRITAFSPGKISGKVFNIIATRCKNWFKEE